MQRIVKTFEKIEWWLYFYELGYSLCRVHIHEMNIREDTFACIRSSDEIGQRSMARTLVCRYNRDANVKKEFSLM